MKKEIDPKFWYDLFHKSEQIDSIRDLERRVVRKNGIVLNIISRSNTVSFHAPGIFKMDLSVSVNFAVCGATDAKNIRAKLKSFMYHGKSTRADFDDFLMRIVLATS
jgi:hypothetical protein